jgi:hypothetical protein
MLSSPNNFPGKYSWAIFTRIGGCDLFNVQVSMLSYIWPLVD